MHKYCYFQQTNFSTTLKTRQHNSWNKTYQKKCTRQDAPTQCMTWHSLTLSPTIAVIAVQTKVAYLKLKGTQPLEIYQNLLYNIFTSSRNIFITN
jgi:hypothetical protein